MTFKVTVLGSSGMFATRDRSCSGYLVQVDDGNLWLDAGPGTWRNLLGYVSYEDLSGVMVTHGHPDHVTDVFQAVHARLYGHAEALPKIPLWGPSEALELIRRFAKSVDDAFDLIQVAAGEEMEWKGAKFTFYEMAHPPETLGVRIESNGNVLSYTADTGAGGELNELAQGADVLICEATSQDADQMWTGHLQASVAGEVAKGAHVKLLVLTHLHPHRDPKLSLDEALAAAGDTPVLLAEDGLELVMRR